MERNVTKNIRHAPRQNMQKNNNKSSIGTAKLLTLNCTHVTDLIDDITTHSSRQAIGDKLFVLDPNELQRLKNQKQSHIKCQNVQKILQIAFGNMWEAKIPSNATQSTPTRLGFFDSMVLHVLFRLKILETEGVLN